MSYRTDPHPDLRRRSQEMREEIIHLKKGGYEAEDRLLSPTGGWSSKCSARRG
jgi:hypothetical protein